LLHVGGAGALNDNVAGAGRGIERDADDGGPSRRVADDQHRHAAQARPRRLARGPEIEHGDPAGYATVLRQVDGSGAQGGETNRAEKRGAKQ
jgi:hypothetical protein